jgi:hypothetical protein
MQSSGCVACVHVSRHQAVYTGGWQAVAVGFCIVRLCKSWPKLVSGASLLPKKCHALLLIDICNVLCII